MLMSVFGTAEETKQRPNIVHIALEDITPMMGCYGDTYAKTPVFDRLAEGGIRYTHAYSVGPVCSVSRSSIVTGMYPTTLGTMHHRSNVGRPPAFLEMIPNQMGKAGYFTANAKGDYNIGGAKWHARSKGPVWRQRKDPKQPFFVKFDFGECHSSITKISEDVIVQQRLNRLKPEDFHDPAKAPIPPYHPEEPMFRKAWSRYYDAVTQVDYRAGEVIAQLKDGRGCEGEAGHRREGEGQEGCELPSCGHDASPVEFCRPMSVRCLLGRPERPSQPCGEMPHASDICHAGAVNMVSCRRIQDLISVRSLFFAGV